MFLRQYIYCTGRVFGSVNKTGRVEWGIFFGSGTNTLPVRVAVRGYG
jgi:hypothetical protein